MKVDMEASIFSTYVGNAAMLKAPGALDDALPSGELLLHHVNAEPANQVPGAGLVNMVDPGTADAVPETTAEAVVGVEDEARDAGLLQLVGGVEPAEAGADDDDFGGALGLGGKAPVSGGCVEGGSHCGFCSERSIDLCFRIRS